MATRYASNAASAWTLNGSNLIGDLMDANVKLTGKNQDVSGIADLWEFAFVTKYAGEINANMYATNDTIELAIGTPITVVYVTGPTTYNGTFVIVDTDHTTPKDGVQMVKLTLKAQGQPSLS